MIMRTGVCLLLTLPEMSVFWILVKGMALPESIFNNNYSWSQNGL